VGTRARVTGVVPIDEGGVLLRLGPATRHTSLTCGCRPDLRRAEALYRRMHRVDRVTVRVDGDAWRAEVSGVSHRLPSTRAVPVPVALGLCALGVPSVVELAA
jgi:hypothetical protein